MESKYLLELTYSIEADTLLMIKGQGLLELESNYDQTVPAEG